MYFGNERDLPKDMLGILREFESRIYRVRKKDASKAWFNKFNTKYSNKNKMYIFLNSDLVENYANNEEVWYRRMRSTLRFFHEKPNGVTIKMLSINLGFHSKVRGVSVVLLLKTIFAEFQFSSFITSVL